MLTIIRNKMMRQQRRYTLILLLLNQVATFAVDAFQATSTSTTTSLIRHNYRRCTDLYNHHRHNSDGNGDSNNSDDDTFASKMLRQRMYPLQIAALEQIYERSLPILTAITPSASIPASNEHIFIDHHHHHHMNHIHSNHPIPFIEFCLLCLLQNDTPYPDSGIRFLLRVSTKGWREQIYRSVGYQHRITPLRQTKHQRRSVSSTFINDDTIPWRDGEKDEEEKVSAISATISQSHNQFGILVGEGEPYRVCFPSEPLEYERSDAEVMGNPHNRTNLPSATTTTTTVWIECQLRHYDTNELLVIMGWQLLVGPTLQPSPCDDDHSKKQHNIIKEYHIDRVDWQDFREMFRPGIGREEWVRICG